ncbi:hypothetical protein [unidentified bacterial endosymbiont]|uniref:hypothetical protein n=1 Tax=unidentified bacterial endosymbiont TaxID=2355 RepID=UPI00209FF695|nr:hypothetical protein [unidentified bacterial endosymbiont]
MSEGEAFSEVNKKDATSQWQKIKNSKKNPANWGSTPDSMEAISKKINRNNTRSSFGELGGQAPAILTPIGQVVSMKDTAASSQAKVNADRDKGLQSLNEREQGIRDEQARAASQQMRDVQREMNDLYGKIATAVRW